MGYLFLSISLFAGAAKGFCGKKTSGYTTDYRDAVLVNVIRMLFCIAIGFVFVLFDGGVKSLAANARILPYAALAGVTTSVFAVTWLLSVRRGAYMLVDVSLMCGILVPVIGCLIFLEEKVTWQDYVGMALLIAAVVCMCIYNNRTKAKLTVATVVLLLICGVCSGLTDFSQKLYVGEGGTAVAAFNFYTYVFAALTLLAFFLFTARVKKSEPGAFPLRRVMPFVAIMALCMFAASYFQTLAAGHLPGATLYPLARGVALMLSAVMSWIFFREKPTVGSIIGMCLAFAGLIVMNLV